MCPHVLQGTSHGGSSLESLARLEGRQQIPMSWGDVMLRCLVNKGMITFFKYIDQYNRIHDARKPLFLSK